MPSNMLYVDTGFPTFNGTETTEAKIAALQNYMYMLLEQLRYSMRNMSPVNFNADGLKQMGTILTEPLEVRLGNAEGQMADFRVDLNGLDMRVGNVEQGLTDFRVTIEGVSSTVTDLSGRMTNAEQTADGFRRNITDLTGRMTTVEETAGGLTTTVKDLSGRMTTSEETAEGFRRDITGLDGRWSKIEETVNGVTYLGPDGRVMINNGSINLTGQITFADLATDAQNAINNAASAASSAASLARRIANGEFSGGSFINGRELYSPTIYANEFKVMPEDESDYTGSYDIYGMQNGGMFHMFSIEYHGMRGPDMSPYVRIYSPGGAHIRIGKDNPTYSITYFDGNADFSNCTVTGLTIS